MAHKERPSMLGRVRSLRIRNRLVDETTVDRVLRIREDLSTYSQAFTFFIGAALTAAFALVAGGVERPGRVRLWLAVSVALAIGAYLLKRREKGRLTRAEQAQKEAANYVETDVTAVQVTGPGTESEPTD